MKIKCESTLNRIPMPKFMKGFVKSMTVSLAKFIVIDATAISAFWNKFIIYIGLGCL